MSSNQKEDLIGKWSVEKLELLGKYLAAYLKILTNQSWCQGYEYIDAFAGTGKPKTRDEQKFVDGSPRIALNLSPSFTQYHFIEQTDWRVEKLQKLHKEFPSHSITIYHGDSNRILREQILPQMPYASKKRAIAFIDPFGMEFQWQTMENLAAIKTVEIVLNFPVMAINRGVLRKNPQMISESAKTRLEQFWGTVDWMVDLYEDEQTLFGPETVKRKLSGKEFGRVFKKRLEEIFPHCSNPVLMANSKNAPLYCLIFAGHNANGKKIAEQIFAKHEKDKQ
ncbi:MAG: three-Cys-motif partner protein TcmP [Deltaproteobacteria bacterium]|nr:three-Cys-motif partner protein TcmP [Deltaproteobacteria bacterium]